MRILVVSDTHADVYNFEKVIRKHMDIDVIVHCGDGASDVLQMKELFPAKMFVSVKGNCDWCCDSPNIETVTLEGNKLFVTHGHIYDVKSSLLRISLAAKEADAKLVIFGHTHIPLDVYEDGVYFLNPGSLKGYKGSYAVVNLSEQGVLSNLLTLDT